MWNKLNATYVGKAQIDDKPYNEKTETDKKQLHIYRKCPLYTTKSMHKEFCE